LCPARDRYGGAGVEEEEKRKGENGSETEFKWISHVFVLCGSLWFVDIMDGVLIFSATRSMAKGNRTANIGCLRGCRRFLILAENSLFTI
jgi:hypothetical protein